MDNPSNEIRQELNDLCLGGKEFVRIPETKRKVAIGWIKGGTERKVSSIINSPNKSERYEQTVLHRAAAAIVLNSYWKIKFCFPILWRWYFYVREYDHNQLLPIFEMGKKKVPLMQYYKSMALLKQLDDCLKRTNRQEAELILQAPRLEKKA